MADARLIARLVETPEWKELTAAFEEARDEYFNKLARRIYSHPESITETDLHYKRGVYRGVDIVLKEPARIAALLQKAADRTETDA